MWTLKLPDLDATARFGQALARLLTQAAEPGGHAPAPAPLGPVVHCVLLRGDLGSGKTTLTRALVQALPGGDVAEVSSPSFTLCNAYPTTPPVLHCDLYRTESAFPDELWDALDDRGTLTLMEWGEFAPAAALPEDYLDIRLETCDAERLATVEPHGDVARRLVLTLQHEYWMA